MAKTIGLVTRLGNPRVPPVALELKKWCDERSIPLRVERESAEELQWGDGIDRSALVAVADPIVTLGGDGTLIGMARHVRGISPVFVGVNFGNLGFLTEVPPEQLFTVLESVLAGNERCAERLMVSARVLREGKVIFESQAVNDVVVQNGAQAPLPELDVSVGGEDVARIRADGVIIATTVGSTAYSLAAGGSIVHPGVSALLVTPICPHSLTNRPIILPATSSIQIELPDFDGEIYITIDGQVSEQLQPGDSISVSQAEQRVRFVLSREKRYFDILRTKLNWGVPNRP